MARLMLSETFAAFASQIAGATGAPFHPAMARWPGEPVYDDGGSITTPGTPVNVGCKVQVDPATDSMRRDAQFVQGDVRLIIIEAAAIDTNCRVEVLSGPHVGIWSVEAVTRDPAGIGYECRGRKWA